MSFYEINKDNLTLSEEYSFDGGAGYIPLVLNDNMKKKIMGVLDKKDIINNLSNEQQKDLINNGEAEFNFSNFTALGTYMINNDNQRVFKVTKLYKVKKNRKPLKC